MTRKKSNFSLQSGFIENIYSPYKKFFTYSRPVIKRETVKTIVINLMQFVFIMLRGHYFIHHYSNIIHLVVINCILEVTDRLNSPCDVLDHSSQSPPVWQRATAIRSLGHTGVVGIM